MSKIPTIAMIPSGYKANKVYSVLPTNGSGDLNFTRTSEATRINQQGLVEEMATGIPRLDYSDGGCPSLLLEPASTNLITHSEDFSNAVWTVFDVTKEPNTIIDPSGNLTGCRVTGLASGNRAIQQIVNVTADPTNDRTYTGSLWIKSPNTTSCQIRVGSAGSNTTITISDEWQRFDAQYVLGATFTAIRLGVVLFNDGDIVDVAFGQVEESSYVTSYIPTNASIDTRDADAVSKTGLSNYINSSEGVLYLEIKNAFQEATNRGITLQSAANDGSDLVGFRFLGTSQNLNAYIRANSSTVINSSVVNAETGFLKVALKYKSAETSLWVNGSKVFEDNSSTFSFSSPLDILRGGDGLGGDSFAVYKDVRIYNQALTDTELQNLTS